MVRIVVRIVVRIMVRIPGRWGRRGGRRRAALQASGVVAHRRQPHGRGHLVLPTPGNVDRKIRPKSGANCAIMFPYIFLGVGTSQLSSCCNHPHNWICQRSKMRDLKWRMSRKPYMVLWWKLLDCTPNSVLWMMNVLFKMTNVVFKMMNVIFKNDKCCIKIDGFCI